MRIHRNFPSASQSVCFDCGDKATEYDHPRGYEGEQWKDIEPVCDRCHAFRELNRFKRTLWGRKFEARIGPRMKDRRFLSREATIKRQADKTMKKFLEIKNK